MVEKGNRIYYWDNMKSFLIFLVVVGHIVVPAGKISSLLHSIIYFFHMPAFVFVSGVFSKNFLKKSAEGRLRKLAGFAVLFVLFQLMIWVEKMILIGHYYSLKILTVDLAPWYLLSMISWLLLVLLISRVNHITGVILALLICVFLPMLDGINNLFAMNRTIGFLPFFVSGYYFEYMKKELIKKHIVVIICTIFVCTLAMIGISELREMNGVIHAIGSYRLFESNHMLAFLKKMIWLAMAYSIIGLIIVVCPKKKYWFSYIGKGTISIYVFHRLIALAIEHNHFCDIFNNEFIYILTGVLISFVLVLVLGIDIFVKPFRLIMDLNIIKGQEKQK